MNIEQLWTIDPETIHVKCLCSLADTDPTDTPTFVCVTRCPTALVIDVAIHNP